MEEAQPALLEPDELASWPGGLAVYYTFTVVERGSTYKVKIDDVIHTGNYDIVLRKHTILGCV